jgi:hypothetical protein
MRRPWSQMAAYLTTAGGVKRQLMADLSFWIVGVLFIGTGLRAMMKLCRQRPALARVAGVCADTAVPLAILSFIAMMSLVVKIAPDSSSTSVVIANVVGWIGIRADDLATALLVGLAPLFIALAGRGDWLPRWLVGWGYLTGGFGLISLIGIYLPALSDLGFLIVPIGLAWMIGAGVVLLRPHLCSSSSRFLFANDGRCRHRRSLK